MKFVEFEPAKVSTSQIREVGFLLHIAGQTVPFQLPALNTGLTFGSAGTRAELGSCSGLPNRNSLPRSEAFMHRCFLFVSLVLSLASLVTGPASADDYLLADGPAWPGRVLATNGREPSLLFERSRHLPNDLVPRVRSLTTLRDGRLVFCSGVDRTIMEWTPRGERVLHHGGYLARQVRTDGAGDLYWSSLETPQDGNPLPDGFITKMELATGEVRRLMTFSQNDVNRDWWGTFDVHDGRIFVASLHQPSGIYELDNSIPRRIAALPISAVAIRFSEAGRLLACDGQGKLYHFDNLHSPQEYQILLDNAGAFTDFVARHTSN